MASYYDNVISALAPTMYWPHAEATSGNRKGTTVADWSGNSRTGTYDGTAANTVIASQSNPLLPAGLEQNLTGLQNGKTVLFDGIDAHAQAATYAPFTQGSKRTVMTWVRPVAGQTGLRQVFNTVDPGSNHFLTLEYNRTTKSMRWYQQVNGQFPIGTDWCSAYDLLPEGQWTHVLLSVEDVAVTGNKGDSVRLYINGRYIGNPQNTVTPGSELQNTYAADNGVFRIGARGATNTTEPFNGYYASTAIWERCLGSLEAKQIYRAGSGLSVPESRRLVPITFGHRS